MKHFFQFEISNMIRFYKSFIFETNMAHTKIDGNAYFVKESFFLVSKAIIHLTNDTYIMAKSNIKYTR